MKYKIMAVADSGTEWITIYRNLEKELAVEIAKRLSRMMNDRYYFYPTQEG